MPFTFTKLTIPEVQLIEPKVFADERGFFLEVYKRSDFIEKGIPEHFVQINHSKSSKGVLRGLHYQKQPHAQGKLVRCVSGAIFDVAVDIREGSPSFRRWVGVELTAKNNRMLYIPPDFAHGFVVLSDSAEIIYHCTSEYSPQSERGIIWDDPEIAVEWPVPEPVLSEKDRQNPTFRVAEKPRYEISDRR